MLDDPSLELSVTCEDKHCTLDCSGWNACEYQTFFSTNNCAASREEAARELNDYKINVESEKNVEFYIL